MDSQQRMRVSTGINVKNNAVAVNIEEIKILSSIKVINLPYSFMLLKV
jgi:hypothetical protein